MTFTGKIDFPENVEHGNRKVFNRLSAQLLPLRFIDCPDFLLRHNALLNCVRNVAAINLTAVGSVVASEGIDANLG